MLAPPYMHFAVHFFCKWSICGFHCSELPSWVWPKHPPSRNGDPFSKEGMWLPRWWSTERWSHHRQPSHPTACIYQCTTAPTGWFPILSRECYSNKPAKRTCSWTVDQNEWAGIPGPQQTCTLPLRSSSLPLSFWSRLRLLRLSQVFLSPPIPLNNNKKQKKPPPPPFFVVVVVLLVDLSPLQNHKQ